MHTRNKPERACGRLTNQKYIFLLSPSPVHLVLNQCTYIQEFKNEVTCIDLNRRHNLVSNLIDPKYRCDHIKWDQK